MPNQQIEVINKTQLTALLQDLESDRIEGFSKLTVFEALMSISKHYLSFTDPVTDPVAQLLKLLEKEDLSSGEMSSRLGIKHRQNFRDNYIHPALELGLITQAIPEKPNSRLQKYKLTERPKKYLNL